MSTDAKGPRYEIQLPSGRWVRYRLLSTSEVERNEIAAGAVATKATPMVEFNANVERPGMAQMVLAYSSPIKRGDRPAADAWKAPAGNELIGDGWSAVFGAKDTAVFKSIYRSEHGVSQDELDAIMAGKVAVLVED